MRNFLAFVFICLFAAFCAGVVGAVGTVSYIVFYLGDPLLIVLAPIFIVSAVPLGMMFSLPCAVIGTGCMIALGERFPQTNERWAWVLAGLLLSIPIAILPALADNGSSAATEKDRLYIAFTISLPFSSLIAGAIGGLAGHFARAKNPFAPPRRLDSNADDVAQNAP